MGLMVTAHHPEYELKWVRQGVGQRMVGDHVESFRKDDLVLVGSNLPHCWRTAPEFAGSSHIPTAVHQIVWGQIRNKKIRDLLDQSRLGLRFDLQQRK